MPNQERENLIESLLPKAGKTTVTVDLEVFDQLLVELLASRKEVNTKAEVARVQKAVNKEPEVAQGIPVEEDPVKVHGREQQRQKNNKGGK